MVDRLVKFCRVEPILKNQKQPKGCFLVLIFFAFFATLKEINLNEDTMKRLYRSKKERMIAGVCGGLSEYFDVDPVLIRAVFALSAFMGGMGIVVYILLAIITPEEGKVGDVENDVVGVDGSGSAKIEEPPIQIPQMKGDQRWIFGLALLALGIFLFLGSLPKVIPWWGWHFLWPIILIATGLYIFSHYKNKS